MPHGASIDEQPRFSVLMEPDANRWGVFHFTVDQPIATIDQLREMFLQMLPVLQMLHARYRESSS